MKEVMPKPTRAEMIVIKMREAMDPRKIVSLLYLIARMAENSEI
jgi:hypothetical protein